MNPIVILARNNLELTKRCVASCCIQDVESDIFIFDNGSSDGTREWFAVSGCVDSFRSESNQGVSRGWNWSLNYWFNDRQAEHVLVVGNDTSLGIWTYSALLSANVPFVTGVDVGMSPLPDKPDVFPLSPHPDFSCFLIRRDCWEKVGPFDEQMVSYAGDCDYHVRAHQTGVPLFKSSTPYNHERSSTMNRADAKERHAIATQANRDREAFKAKWGCLPGTAAYNALFKEPCGQAQTK